MSRKALFHVALMILFHMGVYSMRKSFGWGDPDPQIAIKLSGLSLGCYAVFVAGGILEKKYKLSSINYYIEQLLIFSFLLLQSLFVLQERKSRDGVNDVILYFLIYLAVSALYYITVGLRKLIDHIHRSR